MLIHSILKYTRDDSTHINELEPIIWLTLNFFSYEIWISVSVNRAICSQFIGFFLLIDLCRLSAKWRMAITKGQTRKISMES